MITISVSYTHLAPEQVYYHVEILFAECADRAEEMRVVGNYISGVAADHLADVDDSLVFRLFLRCARQIADPFWDCLLYTSRCV